MKPANQVTILVIGLLFCTVYACDTTPRIEVTHSMRGEKQVTVRGPMNDPDGPYTLTHVRDIYGEGFPTDPPIAEIEDLAVDELGRIYIADRGNSHVIITNIEGEFIGLLGTTGPGPFEFTDSPMYGMQVSWNQQLGLLAVFDPRMKIIFFNPDGSVLQSRIAENAWRFGSITSTINGILTLSREDPPFVIYSINGDSLWAFGRFIGPEDTRWKDVAESVSNSTLRAYPYGGVLVDNCRIPDTIGTIGDSILVHDLENTNGYRAWNIRTGKVLWDLYLDISDFEPPTLYTYTTSESGEMAAWDKGGIPNIYDRVSVEHISELNGLLYSVLWLRGDGKRSKPDHKRIRSPSTRGEELQIREMPLRGALEIMTLDPDLLAHISFDIKGYFTAAIAPGPYLILGYNDPEPHLSVFRIDGAPRK